MRIDPQAAQSLKGEIAAARHKLAEGEAIVINARERLQSLHQQIERYRQGDLEYWDDLAADLQEFAPDSAVPLAEAAPSASSLSHCADGAAPYRPVDSELAVDAHHSEAA